MLLFKKMITVKVYLGISLDLLRAVWGQFSLIVPCSSLYFFSGTPPRHRLGWACILCPSQVQAAQVTRFLASTLSPGGWYILSPPQSQLLSFPSALWEHHLRCATHLLWGADLWLQPSWQMSIIQDPRKTLLATGCLLTIWWRMLSLGPDCPLPSYPCWAHLPFFLQCRKGPVHSWLALLCSSFSPLFCKQTRLCFRAFKGKVLSLSLFFPLSGYPTVWVAVSH